MRPVLAMLCLLTLLTGCAGAPDRQDRATELQTRLQQLPGVDDAHVQYTNDFTHGSHIEIDIGVEHASAERVGEIATTLYQLLGDEFDKFDQQVRFEVAPVALVITGKNRDSARRLAESADLVRGADDVRRIVGALAHPARIELHVRPEVSTLRLDGVTDTDQAIGVAVAAVGTHADNIYVTNIDSDALEANQRRTWDVDGPITVDTFGPLARAVAAGAGSATYVVIRKGRFTQVNLDLPSTQNAYPDLVGAVTALGAGRDGPLRVLWSANTGQPTTPDGPRWAGSLQIGNCGDQHMQGLSGGMIVPEAAAVQQRIRDQFDTCPT